MEIDYCSDRIVNKQLVIDIKSIIRELVDGFNSVIYVRTLKFNLNYDNNY